MIGAQPTMPTIEPLGNRKAICPNCGVKIEKPLSYTNKCKKCYEKEAKIFLWIVGSVAFSLTAILVIKYLVS